MRQKVEAIVLVVAFYLFVAYVSSCITAEKKGAAEFEVLESRIRLEYSQKLEILFGEVSQRNPDLDWPTVKELQATYRERHGEDDEKN